MRQYFVEQIRVGLSLLPVVAMTMYEFLTLQVSLGLDTIQYNTTHRRLQVPGYNFAN